MPEKNKLLVDFSKAEVAFVSKERLNSNYGSMLPSIKVTLTTTQYMRKLMLELMRRRRCEMDSE